MRKSDGIEAMVDEPTRAFIQEAMRSERRRRWRKRIVTASIALTVVGGIGAWIVLDRPQETRAEMLAAQKAGATAICEDGTYSYSARQNGTCSHHGGVDAWTDGAPRTQWD